MNPVQFFIDMLFSGVFEGGPFDDLNKVGAAIGSAKSSHTRIFHNGVPVHPEHQWGPRVPSGYSQGTHLLHGLRGHTGGPVCGVKAMYRSLALGFTLATR